jgi:hypothetical protein
MIAKLHFAKDALALQLLLESPKGLIDIVVANENLHVLSLPKRVEPLQPSNRGHAARLGAAKSSARNLSRQSYAGRRAVIAQATIEI